MRLKLFLMIFILISGSYEYSAKKCMCSDECGFDSKKVTFNNKGQIVSGSSDNAYVAVAPLCYFDAWTDYGLCDTPPGPKIKAAYVNALNQLPILKVQRDHKEDNPKLLQTNIDGTELASILDTVSIPVMIGNSIQKQQLPFQNLIAAQQFNVTFTDIKTGSMYSTIENFGIYKVDFRFGAPIGQEKEAKKAQFTLNVSKTCANPCPAGFQCVDGDCLPETIKICRQKCKSDEICLDGECKKICTGAAQCPMGTSCFNGLCSKRCSKDSQCMPPKSTCNKDTDCDSGYCVNKICKYDNFRCSNNVCAKVCSGDQDCDMREYCDSGSCRLRQCQENSDCDSGGTCVDNKYCQKTVCLTDKNCSTDQICGLQNYCIAKKQCSGNYDCDTGLACVEGYCKKTESCKSDSDCRTGFTCSKNLCIVKKSCNDNADCDYPMSCICDDPMSCKNKFCK